MARPFRTQAASDVAVDDVVQAKNHNTLRSDTLNALGGMDYAATQEILLATSPAVGDTAFAVDTGALYICLSASTWTLWIDPPGQAPATNYWDGLKLTIANIDDIAMGRGTARNIQDTASINQTSTAFIKKLDLVFGDGIGNGMRDPNFGLGAQRWFNLYMLGKRSDPDAVDLFASGVATDSELISSLPTGWNTYAFVGSVFWDGGGIREFFHRGKEFRWKEPQLDVDAKIDGEADVFETVRLSIPNSARTLVRLIVSTSGGADGAVLRTPGTLDSGFTHASVIAGRNAYVELMTDSSGQIEYTMTGATWGSISISTIGWDDERGATMIIPADQTLQFLGTSGETGEGFNTGMAVSPDGGHVIMVDDNGASGGLPLVYATASGVPGMPQINVGVMGGNLDHMRGPDVSGGIYSPDGQNVAWIARTKTTQNWNLTILDLSDPTDVVEAGFVDINALTLPAPQKLVEGIWDDVRGRLYLPIGDAGGVIDIRIFDVSTPGSPSVVGTHSLGTPNTRTSTILRWSENKEVIYCTGSDLMCVLTPSASGDTFSQVNVETFSNTFTGMAHDGSNLIIARKSGTDDVAFRIYSIDPVDESLLTFSSSEILTGLDADVTGTTFGDPRFLTFRNDVLGGWHTAIGSTSLPSAYLTYDFTDTGNPLFLEELAWVADGDRVFARMAQHELFNGLHTAVLWGDIPDEDDFDYEFSVVGYA